MHIELLQYPRIIWLLPRSPDKILECKNVKVSKQNFIQADLIPGKHAKISCFCITLDGVKPLFRNKSQKKKQQKK